MENATHLVPQGQSALGSMAFRLLEKCSLSRSALRLRFSGFNKHLEELLNTNERLVLSIADDYKLLSAVDSYLRSRNLRSRVRVIFFLHGYDYGFESKERNAFYKSIDHLVLMTESSYRHHLNSVLSLECSVSVLRNGVDETRFKRVDESEKSRIRQELGWSKEKKYFLWLSVNRPKKGFPIINRAWKEISTTREDLQLVVIGANDGSLPSNTFCLGRIPNEQLPRYFQAADFYLFPTLWHEGHPLSLTEALRCGTTCLSSEAEPMPEIMSFGKFGRIVMVPHDPDSWVSAIQEEIRKYEVNGCRNPYLDNIPEDIYSLSAWKAGLREILNSVADSFEA
jgi:glycosyltransferase involved in cell wall biosynthesis